MRLIDKKVVDRVTAQALKRVEQNLRNLELTIPSTIETVVLASPEIETAFTSATASTDLRIDGGRADSVYTASQSIDGGTA